MGRRADARSTRHVCTNLRFVATGPDRASGTTLLTVFLHDGDGSGPAVPFVVSDYHDEFVREGGGWRIASRWTETVFSTAQ